MHTLCMLTWRLGGLSKWVKSRVISTVNGVTLLVTDLLSPLGLQVVCITYAQTHPRR